MRNAMLGVMVMMLVGCGGQQRIADDGPYPTPLELEYRSLSVDRRFVYYRLEDDGTLYFGGGRQAGLRDASPAGKITDEQRAELWQIIKQNKLLLADGSGPFADYEQVRYELSIRAGSLRHSFTAVDDEVSGIGALDKALFEMQAELRYDTLFQAIDEKIRKEGGTVKKR